MDRESIVSPTELLSSLFPSEEGQGPPLIVGEGGLVTPGLKPSPKAGSISIGMAAAPLPATGAAEAVVLVSPEQVMREREGAIEAYTKVGEGGTVVPVLEPPSAAEKTAIEDRSLVAPDRNP